MAKVKEPVYNENQESGSSLVEVKVSSDQGETWQRRKIDFAQELDQTGLMAGEMFKINDDKYEVVPGEYGLQVKQIKKPITKKK